MAKLERGEGSSFKRSIERLNLAWAKTVESNLAWLRAALS
jgi:hypothetical protein